MTSLRENQPAILPSTLVAFLLLLLPACGDSPTSAPGDGGRDALDEGRDDAGAADAATFDIGTDPGVDLGTDAGIAKRYRIVMLDATGAESASAWTISSDGLLVGGTSQVRIDGLLVGMASIWGAAGTRTDTPPFAGLSAGILSFADDGAAVGYTTRVEGVDYPIVPAVLRDGAWSLLPTLGAPLLYGAATGGDATSTVGNAVDEDEELSAPWRSRGGVTETLGSFGGSSGHATGINGSGLVVGWSQLTPTGPDDFVSHGFVVPVDSDLRTATHIEGLGGNTTFARAINGAGWVTGDSSDADGVTRAFLWTAAEGIRAIHSPADGESFVLARAINAEGRVVGTEPRGDGGWLAWMFFDGEGVTTLDTVVLDLPAGWHVRDASAVADDGSIVIELHDETDVGRAAVLQPVR